MTSTSTFRPRQSSPPPQPPQPPQPPSQPSSTSALPKFPKFTPPPQSATTSTTTTAKISQANLLKHTHERDFERQQKQQQKDEHATWSWHTTLRKSSLLPYHTTPHKTPKPSNSIPSLFNNDPDITTATATESATVTMSSSERSYYYSALDGEDEDDVRIERERERQREMETIGAIQVPQVEFDQPQHFNQANITLPPLPSFTTFPHENNDTSQQQQQTLNSTGPSADETTPPPKPETLLSIAANALANMLRVFDPDSEPPTTTTTTASGKETVAVDVLETQDVYERFIKSVAECSPLARPDHRTVVIALLRSCVRLLDLPTLTPWHHDHDTSSSAKEIEERDAEVEDDDEPKKELYIHVNDHHLLYKQNSSSSFFPSTTPSQEQEREVVGEGVRFDMPVANEDEHVNANELNRDKVTDNDDDEEDGPPPDALVTSVFLLGLGSGEAHASRLRRLKRAKARFIRRALVLAAAPCARMYYSSTSTSTTTPTPIALSPSSSSPTVISTNIMLSLTLTTVSVLGALARVGCNVSILPHPQYKQGMAVGVDVEAELVYYGTRIFIVVNMTGDAPCVVKVWHRGILSVRHVRQFVNVVREITSYVERFERSVLVFECTRKSTFTVATTT